MKEKKVNLPFGIQSRLLEACLQAKIMVCVSNWVFQGMLYMNMFELLFRLSLEILCIAVLSFWAHIFISILLVHTAFWLLNGHFFVLMRYISDITFSRKFLVEYIRRLESRVERRKDIIGAASFGSLSRGTLSETSDFDLRLFKKAQFSSAVSLCVFCMCERFRAFIAGFPLDVYVFDVAEVENKIRSDEPAILLADAYGVLTQTFPQVFALGEVLDKLEEVGHE